MFLDEIDVGSGHVIARIGTGDHLHEQQSIRFEKTVELSHKQINVFFANSLNHLNGNYLVKFACQMTIILEPKINQIAEVLSADQFSHVRVLFLRYSHSRHPAAECAGDKATEPSPAASQIEHSVRAFDSKLSRYSLELRQLRRL